MTTGLDEQRTILRYKVMRKSGHFIPVEEKPNYPYQTYCNGCKKRWPLEKLFCDYCKQRVRRNPTNKNKSKIKWNCHRY